ncbi:hypothetical protein [Senegalia massiliensis]|uniref:Uncharacterized protein n=1 Tax=Senegalia massiliensis TaxID=1720316 RepID=A0A845QX57_9CLOT|nr:hypothetical protein [Senegalia massiliensis]NBI06096.1 hypothetical protein [Senegalia massiliensis]
MSNFKNDLNSENELAKFLDVNFYPQLIKKNYILNFERIYDKSLQRKGVDVILHTKDNKTITIDEKSSLHYLNKHLPTFAFELSYLDKYKNTHDGWLLDNSKITDFYALIWPNIIDKKYNKLIKEYGENQKLWQGVIKSKDFCNMEIWFIKKSELLSVLKDEYNLSKSELHNICTIIRKDPTNKIYNETKKFKFYISTSYTEKPINIIIWKKFLEYHSLARKFKLEKL